VSSRPAYPRPAANPASNLEGADLRRLFQTFIRSAGLFAGDQTPCGHPVAVSHAHALMVLLETARKGKRATQRELGQALGIDKSNVARLCRRMESAGHLVQSRSADDRRARLLSLTTRGTRLAKNVERSSRDRFQRLMSAVPRRSRAGVLSSLACLNQALALTDPAREIRRARQESTDSPRRVPFQRATVTAEVPMTTSARRADMR
jgi:DNA-binding MarR family transcriptional regulator